MKLPYAEVHAFPDGDAPFTGNPAGVCLLEDYPPDAVLAGIAASNNLSETAFLVPEGEDRWQLRWFTPTVEVDLCGHATFASGAWLFEHDKVRGDVATFSTRSGDLKISRESGGGFGMDLPKIDFRAGDADPAIIDALGAGAPVDVIDIDRVHGARYQMVVFDDEATIASLSPDVSRLMAAFTNVIVTAPGQTADFVSRFFAPASGVTEYPVTGSAHCTLAPYWADKFGRKRLTARQIGPRPGALTVETKGSLVLLSGRAALYLEGEIRL